MGLRIAQGGDKHESQIWAGVGRYLCTGPAPPPQEEQGSLCHYLFKGITAVRGGVPPGSNPTVPGGMPGLLGCLGALVPGDGRGTGGRPERQR